MTPLLWWSLGVLGYLGIGIVVAAGVSRARSKTYLQAYSNAAIDRAVMWTPFTWGLALFVILVGALFKTPGWLARRISR